MRRWRGRAWSFLYHLLLILCVNFHYSCSFIWSHFTVCLGILRGDALRINCQRLLNGHLARLQALQVAVFIGLNVDYIENELRLLSVQGLPD